MPALNLLSTGLSSQAEQLEPLTTAMHAVDQRLLQWQRRTASWQQLLQQVFGRSAPLELSGIGVEILDGQTMAGLHGAYAAIAPDGDERIYLNANWLASANAAAVEAVLLEELGHNIDRRLNGTNDTAGDEGAIFSALIRGVAIPFVETSQNDHQSLIINGQKIAIEAAAPVLDTNASPAFTTINANTGVPSGAVGTLVSALIVSGGSLNNFSDADGDSPAIAITGTNLDGGTLYYSTNNGSSWSDVGTVSEASARVLYADNNTRLAFSPATGYTGTISDLITFKAWDREDSIANGAASITTTPTLTGNIETSEEAINVTLSADGNTAFVAIDSGGLDIIDVSDPTSPRLSSNFDTSGKARAISLSADGNTAFVAAWTGGLDIIDVSDPASPSLTGTIDTSGVAFGVTLSADGDTAFVADWSGGLDIIDVSDSTDPTLKGNFQPSYDHYDREMRFAEDVALSADGNTAFVVSLGNRLDIIDVSDHTEPTLEGNFRTSGDPKGVTLSADGNTAFIAAGYSGLQIIDVSNPSQPEEIGNIDHGFSSYAMDITLSADGNTAFMADGYSGLQIIDVSNPVSPSLTRNIDTSDFVNGVTLSADGNTAFVADGFSGLQIIDVSSTQYFSRNSDTAEITVIDDSRAPTLSTADTNTTGTQIILTYNEELSSTTALQSDFEVSTASAANAVTAVTVDGSSVILTLNRAVTTGQQTTITYNDPTTGDDVNSIQDIVGNDAASLSGLSVANNSTVPDTIAPTLSTAETNTAGTQVILTYDEELSSTTANQSDFEVTTSSATNDVADVTVDDNTVILTLTTPITTGETATVDYNDPTKGDDEYAIQDIVGNDADSLRGFPLDTISSISCEQMAAFTTQAFSTLSRDQIKKIPINAIKCISKTQLSSLPPNAVKGFTKKQIAALSRHVFSAMDEPQLRKLSRGAITGLQKKQLSTLSGAELSAFKPRKLKAFPIDAISGLKPKSLDALNKRQVRAFTDDQLAGLNKKRFKNTTQFVGHLSGQQLEDLSPNAVKKFTSKQIAVLRDSVFAAMGKRQLSKLSKDAVTGLQKGQLKTLDAEELSSFKPKNLSEIAPDAISGLRSESLNALNSRQARAFTDDQLAGLSKKQIKKADDFIDHLSTQQKNIPAIENTRQSRLISDPAITLDDNFALTAAVDPLA